MVTLTAIFLLLFGFLWEFADVIIAALVIGYIIKRITKNDGKSKKD